MINSFEEFLQVIQHQGLEGVGLYYGFYRATVIDNNDPLILGRLKINCPALYGDVDYPEWIFPRGIVGGNNTKASGISWTPGIGAPVYISCENGNARFPVWEYGWLLKGKDVDTRIEGAGPNVQVFQTEAGHRIELNDSDDYVLIQNSKGFHVKLYSDGISIGKDSEDDSNNLGAFLQKLFQLFEATTVATPAGASPFNNVADYTALKAKIQDFLKSE